MVLLTLVLLAGLVGASTLPGIDDAELTVERVDAFLADPNLDPEWRARALRIRDDMIARPKEYEWLRQQGAEMVTYRAQPKPPPVPRNLRDLVCADAIIEGQIIGSRSAPSEDGLGATYYRVVVDVPRKGDIRSLEHFWFMVPGTYWTEEGSYTVYISHSPSGRAPLRPMLGDYVLLTLTWFTPAMMEALSPGVPTDLRVAGGGGSAQFLRVESDGAFLATSLERDRPEEAVTLVNETGFRVGKPGGEAEPIPWRDVVDRWVGLDGTQGPDGLNCR